MMGKGVAEAEVVEVNMKGNWLLVELQSFFSFLSWLTSFYNCKRLVHCSKA